MSNLIRPLREGRGLSQNRLAELVGTSGQQIGNLERGDRRLTDDWMRRIARALGVEPWELLEPTHNPARLQEAQAAQLGARKRAAALPSRIEIALSNPLLLGLIEMLPPAGSPWPNDDRDKWIQTAIKIFDLIYRQGRGPHLAHSSEPVAVKRPKH